MVDWSWLDEAGIHDIYVRTNLVEEGLERNTANNMAYRQIFVHAKPTITTIGAANVTSNSATLNGSLDGLGTASSVEFSFEWGLHTTYGNETTPQTMDVTGYFSGNLTSLASNTTYHFRAKAVGDGIAYGDDVTFTTCIPGDADMDGDVDVFDWVRLRSILMGLEP